MGSIEESATMAMNMTMNATQPALPPIRSAQLSQILSILLTVTIAIVMVGMGCGVDWRKVVDHLKKPTGVIVGFCCQFIIMPTIAFALAKALKMPEIQTLALLIVGSCPGGSTSNVVTYWVDGDMDLSITMTAVSSTLGLGMMPLLLFIYSQGFSGGLRVPFSTIGITIAALLLPIAVGVLIRMKFPQKAPILLKVLSVVGVIAIIAVAVTSIVTYGDNFQLIRSQIICAVLFPGLGMFWGYVLSSIVSLFRPLRLHHYQRRTISLETGIQNTQLATGIIQLSSFTFLEKGKIVLFPVVYLASQLVWVAMMVISYRIYQWKKGPVLAARSSQVGVEEEKGDAECERKESSSGNVNPAFESSEPPKYSDVVENTMM